MEIFKPITLSMNWAITYGFSHLVLEVDIFRVQRRPWLYHTVPLFLIVVNSTVGK